MSNSNKNTVKAFKETEKIINDKLVQKAVHDVNEEFGGDNRPITYEGTINTSIPDAGTPHLYIRNTVTNEVLGLSINSFAGRWPSLLIGDGVYTLCEIDKMLDLEVSHEDFIYMNNIWMLFDNAMEEAIHG